MNGITSRFGSAEISADSPRRLRFKAQGTNNEFGSCQPERLGGRTSTLSLTLGRGGTCCLPGKKRRGNRIRLLLHLLQNLLDPHPLRLGRHPMELAFWPRV